jgi:hypothetical protein
MGKRYAVPDENIPCHSPNTLTELGRKTPSIEAAFPALVPENFYFLNLA